MRPLLWLFLCILPVSLSAQYHQVYVETRIEQEDLKFLEASLWSQDTTVSLPVILIQTPYNMRGFDDFFNGLPAKYQLPLDYSKYHYVVMDWRGRFANSDKDFQGSNRGEDGYDAVEWIARQSWCNGKVATWGGSALGMVQFQTAVENPSHLVCAVPMIAGYRTNYQDYFYGGVLRYEHMESLRTLGFMDNFDNITSHPTHDNVWKYIETNTDYSGDFKIPVMMITGWFDHFPSDIIDDYLAMRENSGNDAKLIIGPWLHGGIGQTSQGILDFPEAEDYPLHEIEKFLDYYLYDIDNGYSSMADIQYFQMGDNVWKQASDWDRENEINFYIHPNNVLRPDPISSMVIFIPPDTIIYDPRHPTPTIGGERFPVGKPLIPIGPQDLSHEYIDDPGVVRYMTDVLEHDVEVKGEVKMTLFVSTDRKDTDFSFRLCDVYPDGKSVILRQGIRRLRLYKKYESFSEIIPHEKYELEISLDDLAVTFKKGHRIQAIVSSSNYPHYDINLNNGNDLYGAGDTLTAINVIHFDSALPSRLTLPVTHDTKALISRVDDDFVRISPNPSSGIAELHVVAPYSGEISYEVYDFLGNPVQGKTYGTINKETARLTIDAHGWPPGLYFVIVVAGNRIYTEKLIIIK